MAIRLISATLLSASLLAMPISGMAIRLCNDSSKMVNIAVHETETIFGGQCFATGDMDKDCKNYLPGDNDVCEKSRKFYVKVIDSQGNELCHVHDADPHSTVSYNGNVAADGRCL